MSGVDEGSPYKQGPSPTEKSFEDPMCYLPLSKERKSKEIQRNHRMELKMVNVNEDDGGRDPDEAEEEYSIGGKAAVVLES